MESLIILIVGVVVGVVIGVLVYRNNLNRFSEMFGKIEATLYDISRRVDYNNDGKFDLKDVEKLLSDKLDELKNSKQ